MRKIRNFSMICMLCLILSCLSVTAMAENCAFSNGICSECGAYEPAVLKNGAYEIRNAGQLYWFANKVNTGATTINGKLMSDILLNEGVLDGNGIGKTGDFAGWTPIGAYTSATDNFAYNGTFDGNGYEISGLYISNGKEYAGLFDCIGSDGTVKNLGVVASYFSGQRNIGIIAGMVEAGGVVSNCYSNSHSEGLYTVGGLVGINYGTIQDSYQAGRSSSAGYEDVGGIAGANHGLIVDCYHKGILCNTLILGNPNKESVGGGIAGRNTGTVCRCYNIGELKSDSGHSGGIVGYNLGLVEDCYNTMSNYSGMVAGGVVAWNEGGTVIRCYNTGEMKLNGMSKTGYVGGITGSNVKGVVKDCYNQGKVDVGTLITTACAGVSGQNSGTIENCYNIGEVSGVFSNSAIVGLSEKGTATNCYYQNNCADSNYYGGVSMTAAQFSSGEVAFLLGEAFGQKIGVDPHPVLNGKKVYKTQNDADGTIVYTNTPPVCQTHMWQPATCTTPKTCVVCHTTSGKPAAHHIVNGICSSCGQSACYLNGHDWKNADCENPKRCVVCGQTNGTALGHDWKAADCENAKFCRTCSKIEGTALGHDWVAADCENPKTCRACGLTEGSALGHVWSLSDCTVERACVICHLREGPAPGHSWQAASCEQPKHCAKCNLIEGTPLGHEWQEATCEEPKTCKVCAKTEGAANGHSWDIADCTSERVCLVCGHTESASAVHQWKDATCEEPRSCVNCGATEGQALGHSWQAATCQKSKTCATCGKTEGEPLEHSFADKWISDQDGHWHSCDCGASSPKESHADADQNGSCDQCSMYIGKDEADNSIPYIVAAVIVAAGLFAVAFALLLKKK